MTKRQRLRMVLEREGWAIVSASEWEQLRGELPDISENSLREWLAEAGVQVDQPYRGVHSKTLAELEESLIAMTAAYGRDAETGRLCRKLVIAAKDRACFASRNPKVDEAKRTAKEEMVQWMLVWLDDPAMFPTWARLRRAATRDRSTEPELSGRPSSP